MLPGYATPSAVYHALTNMPRNKKSPLEIAEECLTAGIGTDGLREVGLPMTLVLAFPDLKLHSNDRPSSWLILLDSSMDIPSTMGESSW